MIKRGNRYNPHAMQRQPWYKSFYASKGRCENPKNNKYYLYGARGIKFDLGFWAMGVLYWRDKAELMDCPSIDRIDSSGDYTFQNCRFIEKSENSRQGRIGKNMSKDARRKIGESKKGNKYNLGRKHSEETRLKMSKSQLKRYAKLN